MLFLLSALYYHPGLDFQGLYANEAERLIDSGQMVATIQKTTGQEYPNHKCKPQDIKGYSVNKP